MQPLHRNNVYGSSGTVQYAIRCDHEENELMINNQHEENMEKIKNQDYIDRLNANARNNRELEESRARNAERMCKINGEHQYNMKKLE